MDVGTGEDTLTYYHLICHMLIEGGHIIRSTKLACLHEQTYEHNT